MSEVVNQFVDVKAIRPHPRNYKIHPEQQIQQLGMSHARLSQFRSIVLWQQTDGSYITLAGHGILEAMKRNGVTQVRADIHPPSLSSEDAEAILLADNLQAQNSHNDDEMLARLLQSQAQAGHDLSTLGSDDETLRQMLREITREHSTDFLKGVLSPQQPSSPPPLPSSPFVPSFSRPGEYAGTSSSTPHTGVDEEDTFSSEPLPGMGQTPVSYFQVTYSLTFEQRAIVLDALKKVKIRYGLQTSNQSLVQMCTQVLQESL